MRKHWWFWPGLLLVLGLTAAAALVWGTNNPVVYMRAGMSWVVLLLTLLLVLPLALGLWWRQRQQAREEALTAAARTEMAEDRRRFLQRLDHELKNPITAVRAGLVNVSGAASDEGRQKALNSMESQMVRLSRLTADLRKIAELETRTVEQVAVDLPELLDEVVEFVREHPNSEDKSIKLSVPNAPWPLPALRGDWDLLFLAVYNLVDNALKFSGPGDTVELRAREDGRFVILEVADTGPGIEAGEQPYVWEELYRGTAAGGVTGSGLGLSLVKAVAERHQGRVELHSRPGQGTLVSMVLPVAERV